MFTAFRMLARLRRLRGTPLDPFGRTQERRTERRLIDDYEALIDRLIAGLDADRLAVAVQLASIPDQIRGFGHVKERHLKAALSRQEQLLAEFDAGRRRWPEPREAIGRVDGGARDMIRGRKATIRRLARSVVGRSSGERSNRRRPTAPSARLE